VDAVRPRFLVVGESLVDIVHPLGGETALAPGGSPMNVAVGLSRLGVPTTLVTELGDDANGAVVADHVRASGVELADGAVRPGGTTSVAIARLAADGAATYDFELGWSLPEQRLGAPVAGVHVGSLGAVLQPGRDSVLGLLRQARDAGAFVSYDPNVRPAFLPGWEEVATVARYADLVKMSDEDLALLRPEEAVSTVAHELLATGRTSLVVVTRGGSGALGFTADARVEVEAARTDVVDTVGAGDSFMAALVAVLLEWDTPDRLDGERLRTLLLAAAIAASITCARRGANPPTRQELPPGWPSR
jgi:fructokinase